MPVCESQLCSQGQRKHKEGEVAVAAFGQPLNQSWLGWTATREWRAGKGQGQAVVRDEACWGSTIWEQVLPD